MPDDRGGLGGRKVSTALPPGDRGKDLNGGDVGDIERMSRLGADEGFDPGSVGLDHMAFDERAGIEEVMRYLSSARG